MSGGSKGRKSGGDQQDNVLSELETFDQEYRSLDEDGDVSEALRERLGRLLRSYSVVESLLDVSASITSTLNLTELLEKIVDSVLELADCQRGFLMLKNEDGTLSLEIARIKGQNQWKEDELEISKTVVREVAETQAPVFSSNIIEMQDVKVSESIHMLNINSVICLPLEFEGTLVGVIYADSKFISDKFLDSDIKVMKAFAAQAAIAINNARQHGELKLQRQKLEEQNISLRHQLGEEFATYGMITNDKKMEEIFEAVNKIAPSDIYVLVLGESGTGKELLARAIHEKSKRNRARFEPVNCAAIPAGLVESTFFGHKRGAFTGAVEDRPGVFELAHEGTLFLDEIGDMPLDIQAKILRSIQDGEVRRIGEPDKPRQVDVRIITATNIDLSKAVKEGRFRDDLYFRLKVAQLELPPLRKRRGDIIPLAEYFLRKHADEKEEPLSKLHKDAKEFLLRKKWEGNIRVLKSAIEFAIVFQDENHWIRAGALEKFFSREEEPIVETIGNSLKEKLQHYEAQVIRRALVECSWNITSAAKALEISRQQLHNKIKKFDISGRGE
jgi:transcriptional regulator with GAF, ATPase, and Fis domain